MANTKVTTGVIKDDAVGADQLAPNAVVTASMVDNAVTTAKIANDAILTAKISDNAVNNAKLSSNSVDSDQYVDGSIDTAHIADSQITSAKLDTNIAVDGTLTVGSHLIMGDNDRIKIGSGTDLEIYHDGSDTFIDDSTGTGNLYVLSNQLLVNNANGTQNMGRFADGGAVTLYYAGDAKLATASGGVTVTGNIANTSGDMTLDVVGSISLDADDSGHVRFKDGGSQYASIFATGSGFTIDGTGDLTLDVAGDMIIDVDGGDIYLNDGGTGRGQISMANTDLTIISATSDRDLIFKGVDGASVITALTLDMSEAGTAIFNHDIQMSDLSFLRMGAGGDLIAYSDGTHALINANNGNLTLDVAGDIILDADGGDISFKDGGSAIGSISMANNDITLTASSDDLILTAADNIHLICQGNESGIDITGNGAVTLYHDNAVKLATIATGVSITGDISPSGSYGTSGTHLQIVYPAATNAELKIFRANGNTVAIFNEQEQLILGGGTSASDSATGILVQHGSQTNKYGFRHDGANKYVRIGCPNSSFAYIETNASSGIRLDAAVSKASGSFRIKHPLPSKNATHDLVHSFIEGPQADNIYRGVVALENGTATINIDTISGMTEGTYVLLNTNTSCFTSNETDWDAVKGSVSGNILTISCQNSSSTATVSWLVIGERHDQHMKDTGWTDADGKVIVEPLQDIR